MRKPDSVTLFLEPFFLDGVASAMRSVDGRRVQIVMNAAILKGRPTAAAGSGTVPADARQSVRAFVHVPLCACVYASRASRCTTRTQKLRGERPFSGTALSSRTVAIGVCRALRLLFNPFYDLLCI
jgi:hypothetical protein